MSRHLVYFSGIRLKRIRDHDDMLKEELEAKRMKMKAVFAGVIESRKKKKLLTMFLSKKLLTMKEGAVRAMGGGVIHVVDCNFGSALCE